MTTAVTNNIIVRRLNCIVDRFLIRFPPWFCEWMTVSCAFGTPIAEWNYWDCSISLTEASFGLRRSSGFCHRHFASLAYLNKTSPPYLCGEF
jgi:hypothetical protein